MADTPCEGDLVVSLVDAQGVDASGHRATFSAPVQVREVDVLPPLPVALRLTGPQTIKASATASFAVSLDVGAATVSQATVTISVAETQDSQNREYVCQTLAPDGRCPRIVAGETDNTPWFLSMPFNNQGSGTAAAIGIFFYEANRALGTREINAQVSFRDASNNVAYGLDAMGHQIEFVQDPATGMHDVKIEPNVTYTLHTALSPDGKSVSATATFNFGDWEINKGHVDIAYDPLKLELTSACNDSQGGANFVKCSQPGSGVIRFDLADSGVTGAVDIGAAKFAPVQDATGTATLTISAADLYNGVPYTPEIVAGPNTTGSGKRTFTIADNGTVTNAPATTTGSSVRSNAVRATSIRTGPASTVV
ncbi:MAG: hypothetical protein EBQ56_00755, partial [Proteobacteria bacterium]|nr:hypothetical protein [Pseudomonadota bacterium]